MTAADHTASSIGGQPVPPGLLAPIDDSAPLLADPAALRARFQDHGYVLLRNLIPQPAIRAARAEVLHVLREVGEVDGPADNPVATGISRRAELHPDLGAFWRNISESAALRQAVHHPALQAATAKLLNTETVPFDFVWLRAVTAGRSTPFHFDHPYMNRGSATPLTCWVPLGDVRIADGPIVLVDGSMGFDDLTDQYRGRDVDRESGFSGSLPGNVIDLVKARGARFVTTDFSPGDVLVFGMFLLHGSLDNRATGGRVRLSCDVRYQPASDARDDRWFGHPPKGHGNRSYGGLNGANPLTRAPIAR
jgi:ectoine hydroxylase-related dioxygenase (phytanoyl-CoA dioxygenase family)